MRIADILRTKGTAVTTVAPDLPVRELLGLLADANIGAVVVCTAEGRIAGIVSERDIVRHLHRRGAELLTQPVSAIMTGTVRTCAPDDRVDELRQVMTDHRIRHVPVLTGDRLAGLVSIGDVVKSAISELAEERSHLVDYLQGRA